MPNVTSAGPPGPADRTIEVPKPTVWPMVLSLGLGLAGLGLSVGSTVFALLGGGLAVLAVWRWFRELLTGEGRAREELAHARPAPVSARPGTVERLKNADRGSRPRLPQKIYPVTAGLKGGLVGGLVMPLPALAWGVLSGHGLWFPVNLLAGMVLPGVQALKMDELEQFRPLLLAVGVVIHAVMSAVIGLVYGVLLPLLPAKPLWQLLFGGVTIPLVWTGFSAGCMGVANPVLQTYVNWFWFAVSQMVFGLAAAIVVVRTEQVDVAPAGGGPKGPGGRQP